MKKTLGFIGGGRITKIFLQAFSNRGLSLQNVAVCDSNNETLLQLKKKFPQITIASLVDVARKDIILLAIHPPVIMGILEQLRDIVQPDTCILSLAPKITIEKISSVLGGFDNIARMIPNATSYINKGYNPVCFQENFNCQDEILDLLKVLGDTFITEESKLEAYAIASAMLPTYFWFQWQEMQKIAAEMGLNEQESRDTVEKTLAAALETFYHSGLENHEVIDLIPVKPIAAHESQIREILSSTLTATFEKIKP